MAESISSEGFEVTLRGPQGRHEKLTIQCNRLVIGSGAHCEVRLPMEQAAVEHVELTVVDGRVHARARAFEPSPTIGGTPFVEAYLEPGTWVGIGPFHIVATPVALTGGALAAGEKAGGSKVVRVAIAVLALGLLAAAFSRRGAGDAAGPPMDPPALWPTAAASCPQTAPAQALALGRERRLLAEGKRERRPFQVRDGVAAVSLFATAAACFTTGGDPDQAASAAQAATDLRGKVLQDYHSHQVRLEHALLVHDSLTAQHEVKVLRGFTEGASGPYTSWLSDLDRRLQLELAKESKT